MKKIITIILCATMMIMICGCASDTDSLAQVNSVAGDETDAGTGSDSDSIPDDDAGNAAAPDEGTATNASDDETIAEAVLDNFMALAQIPRETYNEQAVSDYLLTWARDLGFEATQDDHNNIVIDIPATEGYEDAPLVVLQSHTDMVIAVDEDYDFTPSTDPIKIIRDGDTITAEHTTLGADDGIGIAIIQYIAEHSKAHGPLRIIFTTDEEKSMSGVDNLDPGYLKDVAYMINIDNEDDRQIVVSSAGFVASTADRQVTAIPVTKDTAYEIAITGSAGGHSGNEIGDGRVNSMVALCDFLYYIRDNGIDYQLVSARSGNAANAIPVSAKATIVMDSSQEKELEELINANAGFLKDTYSIKNPDIDCTMMKVAEIPAQAMSPEDANALICLVQNAVNGIYTLSQKEDGLVESSSNPGILDADTENIHIQISTRSSETAPGLHIVNALKNLAETLDFTISCRTSASPWPMNTDSSLCDTAARIYKKQNGSEPEICAIHAGLECGSFAQKNPDMDIISVGPTVTDVHTTRETAYLSSVLKVVNWVDELVAELAK